MTKLIDAIKTTKLPDLPTVGILAFALASTWSLFQLFYNSAIHPTWLYCLPAALVEIVTAWLVYQAVKSLRIVTDTKASKRDRKFHAIVAVACGLCMIAPLAASFAANRYEFNGDVWLAALFPVGCISCAVASAIPHSVKDRKTQQDDEHKKKLRDAVKALTQARAERDANAQVIAQLEAKLARPHTMIEPPDTAWEEYRASLNGDGTPTLEDCARWYNHKGWYAPRDSTLRHRLGKL